MGNHLLIAIPTKTARYYAERAKVCEETWLKDCPCDYRFFSDADLGLRETNQHDNANDPIRTRRTKLMVKYAYERGHDYIFRVDTDAYVWVNRLLHCGFEQWDYSGWCNEVPDHLQTDWCMTSAHGGTGFFLSRKAMRIVMDAPVEKYCDGKFWGDLWCGQQLWKHKIRCHRDTRFLDGGHEPMHHGNIAASELPLDHQYVSVHPVNPCPENFYAMRDRFPKMSDETVPPERQIWWRHIDRDYGVKRPEMCLCEYCRSS